jgi:hypothetical protein
VGNEKIRILKGEVMFKMTVDLGEYGVQELDFEKSFDSSDLENAMRKQPGNYDWFASVHDILKKRLDEKIDFLKETVAVRREAIADKENETRSKKVSQKELDSLVEKDGEVLTVKEEVNDLTYKVRRLSSHLTALSQFHSILKELSRRERASVLINSTTDEDMQQKALDRVKEGNGKKRRKPRG